MSSRRASFSSSLSDGDHPYRRAGVEHAYSFVGMHCIFDQCKSSGIFLLLFVFHRLTFCDFSSKNESVYLLFSYCSEVWSHEF